MICRTNFHKRWKDIKTMAETKKGRNKLSKLFNLFKEIQNILRMIC